MHVLDGEKSTSRFNSAEVTCGLAQQSQLIEIAAVSICTEQGSFFFNLASMETSQVESFDPLVMSCRNAPGCLELGVHGPNSAAPGALCLSNKVLGE